MLEWPLLVLMGLLAGAYGALVGAGGGFIIGPLFLIFFGMEPGLAVGTTLCLVFINSAFGTLAYARQGRIDFRSGGTFGLAAMPGSVIGALALSAAPGDAFRVAFGALLLLITPVMIFRPPLGDQGGRGLGKSGPAARCAAGGDGGGPRLRVRVQQRGGDCAQRGAGLPLQLLWRRGRLPEDARAGLLRSTFPSPSQRPRLSLPCPSIRP